MTDGLFPDGALPPGRRKNHVRLHGPYARQVTGWRLKFWFAMTGHPEGDRRYELSYDGSKQGPVSRFRGTRGDQNARRCTPLPGFRKFLLPDDLTCYPSIAYPRFAGDRIEQAMLSMLPPEAVADMTLVRMLGVSALPNRAPEIKGDDLWGLLKD